VGPDAMVGAGAVIPPDTVVGAGARIEPGETFVVAR
jgi:acetyltransferase-like isoleucine patch superfamily enzyme